MESPAAHPNARFTAPASQCPTIDLTGRILMVSQFQLLFLEVVVCLIFHWFISHLVESRGLLGATLASETTAAAEGNLGNLRRDPMAMLPFCGYNMGDYFKHWMKMGKMLKNKPRIFHVNWFRKDEDGSFMAGFVRI